MNDEFFMRIALAEAEKARGRTNPNPMVGAVIVKNGMIIAKGFHACAGCAHAEMDALRKLSKKQARGATLYSTLEPCDHYGRTPPCTKAIIESRIKRVVYAAKDPNPKTNGDAVLKKAGVTVAWGVLEKEARMQNEVFLVNMKKKRPFVAYKYAQTLDGKTATRTGDSKWVSGKEALALAHRLRNEYQAICVGIGTVVADNPRLTCRMKNGRNPLRVIVDAGLRIPLNAKVFADDNVVVATSKNSSKKIKRKIEKLGVRVIECGKGKHVDVRLMLKHLYKMGVCSILLEGGGTLASSFLFSGFIDKIYAVVAPKIVGESRYTPMRGKGVSRMKQAKNLGVEKIEKVGSDVLIVAYPK